MDLLALAYQKFCGAITAAQAPLQKSNPSGYVEKQGEFAQRVAREVQSRTGWKCELNLARQTDFSEPLNRVNTEPAVNSAPEWDESTAWESFVAFYC